MTRIIKVRILGRNGIEIKEVNLQEAERILENTYAEGGLVVDARTNEIVWRIGPDVEEVMVVEMLGGG